jgi:MinD superfamily P-loop ATPase
MGAVAGRSLMKKPMTIAIASGKGGTGKTTLSTNLSALWAEKRQVVLMDLDVEEPNSGLFLNGTLIKQEIIEKFIPQWNPDVCKLCGKCQEVCEFNAVMKLGSEIMVFPELCHGCYACSDLCPNSALPMVSRPMGELNHYRIGSLDFIEGRLAVGEEQAVPAIKRVKAYQKQELPDADLVIMDSPPGTSCPVIEAVKDVDFVILITEPTPFGLHDLRLAVETVRGLERNMGIVINRDGIGDNGVERYCAEEGLRILARIPQDRGMAETYSAGELIYPSHPAMKNELSRLIDFLEAL